MDTWMREKARQAMKRILEAASYEVEEVESAADLSAIKGHEAVLVLCSDAKDEIEKFDQTAFSFRIGEQNHAVTKLLFNPSGGGAECWHCVVWGVEDFVRHAGEAALAEVMDRNLILELESPTRPLRGGGFADEEEEEDLLGPEIPHLPVKITMRRAMGIAGIEGDAKCRFVPYWHYQLTSHGEETYNEKTISFEADEEGGLNAINGSFFRIDAENIDTSAVPFKSTVMQPKITKKETEERLLDQIIEKLSQRLKIRYEKGDAIFYEDRVFAPRRADIDLDLQMVYLPVWQIRDRERIIEVNGFTGEILETPVDEGVEIF